MTMRGCGSQTYIHVHPERHSQCRTPAEHVPTDSWFCFCEEGKSTRASESGEQEVIRIDLCRRSCCSGLDGSPLRWPTGPASWDMGTSVEDLVVGVMSFDSVNADRDTSGDLRCSTYSSVSYYRSWIRKVMADEVPRSKCKMPPKDELPLPPPDLSVLQEGL